MKHLTVDEIIDFVSFDRIDTNSLEMSEKINGHIRNCSECMRKVRAFQMIYDEFVGLGKVENFKSFLYTFVKNDIRKNTGKNSSEDIIQNQKEQP